MKESLTEKMEYSGACKDFPGFLVSLSCLNLQNKIQWIFLVVINIPILHNYLYYCHLVFPSEY